MNIAIFENIMTPGGHEVDFDRILVEELKKLGHSVSFYVPEDFVFAFDYHTAVHRLKGSTISYTGVTGLKKVIYSIRREIHRQNWYEQLYKAADTGEFDAIIVPTSTYRYLRALSHNILRKTPVPLLFVLHGINPGEAPKFLAAAGKLLPYKNVYTAVLTFGKDIFGKSLANIHPIYPPVFSPRDISYEPSTQEKEVLRIGFFGQYRREKKLEDFLQVFVKGHYTRAVKLLVQGSTMHPEDAEDFDKIIQKYSACQNIEFLHKGLIGAEWQRAIADVDVLLMPYSAPRYRYHWGGMLFTAIGFHKPVIVSDDMNPEVFAQYHIGETFASGDMDDLQAVLEQFINGFDEQQSVYAAALQKASEVFAPEVFAQHILQIMQEKATEENL